MKPAPRSSPLTKEDTPSLAFLRSAVTAEAHPDESPWPLKSLSPRECEVLRLIGEGHSIRKTAAALKLSPKTVETYRDRIKRKLAVRSSEELRHLAVLARVMDQTLLSRKLAQNRVELPTGSPILAVVAAVQPTGSAGAATE